MERSGDDVNDPDLDEVGANASRARRILEGVGKFLGTVACIFAERSSRVARGVVRGR